MNCDSQFVRDVIMSQLGETTSKISAGGTESNTCINMDQINTGRK